jgi:hypothetical protein
MVAGTPAKIAFHFFPNDFLGQLAWVAIDQIDRRHDHTGRAKAALQRMMFPESLLYGVKLVPHSEALDCSHLCAIGLNGKHRAGLNRCSINMNDAASALRGVAPDMGSGQAKRFAQKIGQEKIIFDIASDFRPVYGHRYGRQTCLPFDLRGRGNIGAGALHEGPDFDRRRRHFDIDGPELG